MSIVKLSKQEVEIKEALTWGDNEKLQSILMSGAKLGNLNQAGDKKPEDVDIEFDTTVMLKGKYALLEVAIIKIKDGEKEIPYTKEWMDGLSIEDGEKLYNEVEKLSKKK